MVSRTQPLNHGTYGGYQKHYKNLEEYGKPCDPCRRAQSEARERRKMGLKNTRPLAGALAERIRQDTVRAYKYNTPCADCKQYFHPDALDLDHVGEKTLYKSSSGQTRKIWRLPWTRFWKEMDNVEVVCAACHRLRTLERRTGKVPERSRRDPAESIKRKELISGLE